MCSYLRWRLGLHSIQGVIILSFFLGLFFRPASLYHPQRDAISHIKHQKEKVKGVNRKENVDEDTSKQSYFSVLDNSTVRGFLLASIISSLGVFYPIFNMVNTQFILKNTTNNNTSFRITYCLKKRRIV